MNNGNLTIIKNEERLAVIGKISGTLKTNNADGKPYFSKTEISRWRAYISPATSTEELKIRANDLQKELNKRQYTFGNNIPQEGYFNF